MPSSRRPLHHAPHRRDSGTMASYPRQPALRRPPPIPIHDDGDVQPTRARALQRKAFDRAMIPIESVCHLLAPCPAGVTSGVDALGASELYQSIPRVKYIAAATAKKLATAPTSSALSSSRSSR